ncbi:MAG TPA: bifunctional aspartate kinase/homoserine dehydrogenase I [Vicinamibacterales bacterium]
MRILKFGGSSVSTPAAIRKVQQIALDARRQGPIVVVVSAFGGVTNELIECARLAERGDTALTSRFAALARRHRSAIRQLVGSNAGIAKRRVDSLLAELREALHGIELLRHCPPRALDVVAGFGERLSAVIIAASLNRRYRSEFVDARELIVTDDQFTHANVLFRKTNRQTRANINRLLRRQSGRVIPIVTGFIAATEDGRSTTLGRNGSDYSAAIIGAALGASMIEIWTDVDGVLSADPRIVPSAFVLPHLTYEEAMELSYFGAKVLHSATIAPAVARRIPILIKNTFNPDAPGTLISARRVDDERLAKGITSVDELTLVTVRGPGMVGVPGVAERLFRALAVCRISVILISQASSEHTICFAIRGNDTAPALDAIRQEFALEMHRRLMLVESKTEQAIVAVVGEGMKGRPGVSGKLFDALGRQSINISAIAQGASERNISCVIDAPQQARALDAIHQAFFENRTRLALAIVGVGNVGSAVIRQLHQQRDYLLSRGFDIKVVALANSRRYVFEPDGINLQRWKDALDDATSRMNAKVLAQRMGALEPTNVALVDCTAEHSIVDAYPDFVDANLHIVTPNKIANALPWARYSALMTRMERRRKHFLFEANVGAGLPIVSTLRDLVASGDEIHRIEGVLSGTLSYLFNHFDGSTPFSSLVADAHRLGLTEPDPREDLSGQDVARKLLILGRMMGRRMELGDVRVDSLVPRALRHGAYTGRWLRAFAGHDDDMAARLRRAHSRGKVLRYTGTIDARGASASLVELPSDHSVALARGTDNVIAFYTNRYSRTPLVVQGPGAGADVTATGVFSDILKLLHYLPR